MKIGIIVHSQTGNTYSVAQKLNERLSAAGHSLCLEKVTAMDDKQAEASKIQLKDIPNVSGYDALVFGAPVHAFSVSPIMKAYLSQTASLQGKEVFCFVTQHLRYPWMGGNRAVDQMKKLCRTKGANVIGSGIINWSNKRREKMIDDMVEELSKKCN